jgi:predicted transcriptional regulator
MILDTIRKQIQRCGKTRYQISKETGICQAALSRLMSGKRRSIHCKSADILLKYFGFELVSRAKKRKAG